jgi:hypothetical protein
MYLEMQYLGEETAFTYVTKATKVNLLAPEFYI